jgi:hypothetical protein
LFLKTIKWKEFEHVLFFNIFSNFQNGPLQKKKNQNGKHAEKRHFSLMAIIVIMLKGIFIFLCVFLSTGILVHGIGNV